MHLKQILPVLCIGFGAGLAAPAMAQDEIGFQSPSGNIHCVLADWGGGADVRCDMGDLSPSYRKRPADCDLDWGSSFGVGASGKGYVICAGDTVMNARYPVLSYGQAVSMGGISCVSSKTGMTCTNAAGHGFSIAKAKQKLF